MYSPSRRRRKSKVRTSASKSFRRRQEVEQARDLFGLTTLPDDASASEYACAETAPLPPHTVHALRDIMTRSMDAKREMGGYIDLATGHVTEDAGTIGTGSRTFMPSPSTISASGVVRFHTHPLKSFDTPASYQDILQVCREYAQHLDGIQEHVILTPGGFFVFTLPVPFQVAMDSYLKRLQQRHPRQFESPAFRKSKFTDSELFDAMEKWCSDIERFQTCTAFNSRCANEFMARMRARFLLPMRFVKWEAALSTAATVVSCRPDVVRSRISKSR